MSAQENPLQDVITRCWEDDTFKERLLDDELLEQVAAGYDGGGSCLEHGAFAYRPDGPGRTTLLETP